MSVRINIISDGSRIFLQHKHHHTNPRPNWGLEVGWTGASAPKRRNIHPSPNIIIIFILILLATSQADGSCRPHTCNGLDIKYPFWIPGIQESNCGSARFNISCSNNSSAPVIKINGDDYIIKDIFYKNASLLLAHSAMLDADCPVPRRNFSVAGTPFGYGPATTDLFFFYNCTTPYDRETYTVDCASNATRHAFAVFHVELLPRWNYSVRDCQPPVNAPVEAESIAQLLKMNYTVILNKGFVLQWKPKPTVSGRRINLGLKIAIGIGAATISAIAMCVLFSIFHHHHYKTSYATKPTPSHEYPPYPDLGKDLEKAGIHIFDYLELEEATHDFDPKMEVGDGGYGAVYKGKLPDGRVVAVKRLYQHHYRRMEQFLNEVEILARLRHQNLVALYGCTSCHSKELLLVYEYISNGTLADHLHGERAKPGGLSWATRLSIAIETASALAYLHASGIIHRDIKSCNILLDDNFVVKVADFGLSRLLPPDATHVSTAPQGTPGYVDPEYGEYYQLTEKSDIYSFGVVLIELISSKLAVDITRHRHEINLSSMAINKIQNHEWCDLVDPYLGFESDCEVRRMVVGVAELAFRCLQNRGDMRPDIQDVLNVLEEIQSKDYSTDVMDQE